MRYELAYRTGGTINAQWHRVLGLYDLESATVRRDDLERMGYKTLIYKQGEIDTIGLPTGYYPEAH